VSSRTPERDLTDRVARDIRETAEETVPEAIESEPELARHPGPAQYVFVAVVLSVVTLLEVALYYFARSVEVPRIVLVALLLGMGALKFALVVLWFMHLRFDNPLFRRVFTGGLVLAILLYVIVLVIFSSFKALWLVLLALAVIVGIIWSLLRVERRVGRGMPREPVSAP
jgi:cytochrome c oxidase subunit IV